MDQFLGGFFSKMDYAWAQLMHGFCEATGGALNGFFKYYSLLGFKALPLILIGLVLFIFAKTRKNGTAVLIAIIIGALITNVILKNALHRYRPYASGIEDYRLWWQAAGGVVESEWSFPSGHATASFALATGVFLTFDKRYSWSAYIFALIMIVARNYLMVHYLSDVLVGAIVGTLSGVAAYFITNYVFAYAEKNKDKKFWNFFLSFTPFAKRKDDN